MEYTQSNLPRIVESYLLLKQSVTSTRLQAERAYNSFRTIDDEFSLTGSRILEIGAGGRGSLLKLFDETSEDLDESIKLILEQRKIEKEAEEAAAAAEEARGERGASSESEEPATV